MDPMEEKRLVYGYPSATNIFTKNCYGQLLELERGPSFSAEVHFDYRGGTEPVLHALTWHNSTSILPHRLIMSRCFSLSSLSAYVHDTAIIFLYIRKGPFWQDIGLGWKDIGDGKTNILRYCRTVRPTTHGLCYRKGIGASYFSSPRTDYDTSSSVNIFFFGFFKGGFIVSMDFSPARLVGMALDIARRLDRTARDKVGR